MADRPQLYRFEPEASRISRARGALPHRDLAASEPAKDRAAKLISARAPYSVQSIERQFEQFAERNLSVIRHFVETVNRFSRRLDIELPVAAGGVDAALAARLLRCFRGLPGWKIILLGD